MPVAPTYPGVYIEEIPSGVRTITGVATSITAFLGRAKKGPVDEPVTINNYGDFERTFGDLWKESTLGFAVRDFYDNGGSQAVIVRLYKPKTEEESEAEGGGESPEGGEGGGEETNEDAGKATLTLGGLKLVASSPGVWGNKLRARVDHDVKDDVATRFGVEKSDLFNLAVRDDGTGITETFRNVTVKASPRKIDQVLESSALVRASALSTTVPEASKEPAEGGNAWGDNSPATNTKAGGEGHDGEALDAACFTGDEAGKKGLYALEKTDLFNLLCLPPYKQATDGFDVEKALIAKAATYCEKRRAMLLVDSPSSWKSKKNAKDGIKAGVGTWSKNAALFFPRLRKPDPLKENQLGDFAPCGAVAGVFARTDVERGVWKAPAGLEAVLNGVPKLSVPLTDDENGELNPLGVNCLRNRPPGIRVIWGARTLKGDDRLASEWKYIPVRRLALFLEESLYRGTQWVVFEPNDEPLWGQIRLNVGAFMHNLFRQGAFQGTSPKEAYFVKCDGETTPQNDIDLGIVNIVVGFAPLKPAEFVILKIQQMAGQIAT